MRPSLERLGRAERYLSEPRVRRERDEPGPPPAEDAFSRLGCGLQPLWIVLNTERFSLTGKRLISLLFQGHSPRTPFIPARSEPGRCFSLSAPGEYGFTRVAILLFITTTTIIILNLELEKLGKAGRIDLKEFLLADFVFVIMFLVKA